MADSRRCQVLPDAGRQVGFFIDGRLVLRWHEGLDYPRPYFFPVTGPSGSSLTRMGHPGAPNHDHHQSVWFAHHKVLGIDFWGNSAGTTIRQSQWLAYEDGDDECRMAVELQWRDGHDPAPLITQQLICCVGRLPDAGEFTIELQSQFRPTASRLEFQQTNFGFLAVRVAKSISEHFGGGTLTSSEGGVGERQIFEQPARWVDYSGMNGLGAEQVLEGMTCVDHPSNPGQPTGWHVRGDGWMCASPTMRSGLTTTSENLLRLRYLLLIHRGGADADRADALYREFAGRPALQVNRGQKPHVAWEITRNSTN